MRSTTPVARKWPHFCRKDCSGSLPPFAAQRVRASSTHQTISFPPRSSAAGHGDGAVILARLSGYNGVSGLACTRTQDIHARVHRTHSQTHTFMLQIHKTQPASAGAARGAFSFVSIYWRGACQKTRSLCVHNLNSKPCAIYAQDCTPSRTERR